VAVTFEQFQKVTRALVMHLRQHEDSVEEGMSLCGVFFNHTCSKRKSQVGEVSAALDVLLLNAIHSFVLNPCLRTSY
jgi:hypothetical protein